MSRRPGKNAADPVEFDYEPAEQDSFPVHRDPRPEAVAGTLHAPGRETGTIARLPSSCRRSCRAARGGRCGRERGWSALMAAWPGLPALLIRRRAILAAPVRYCLLVEPASAHSRPARWARGLLYCGLAAGPVFVTTFRAEGATRDGYRPSRHRVSSLALGPRGQVQAANFAVTGTLVLAGAAGLGHAADPALSGRAGRALIGAALFATDR